MNTFPFNKGNFEFREFMLSAPAYPATMSVPHKLSFVPRDLIQTSVIGGPVTWSYDQFTPLSVVVTISAKAVVRCFLGTYSETN